MNRMDGWMDGGQSAGWPAGRPRAGGPNQLRRPTKSSRVACPLFVQPIERELIQSRFIMSPCRREPARDAPDKHGRARAPSGRCRHRSRTEAPRPPAPRGFGRHAHSGSPLCGRRPEWAIGPRELSVSRLIPPDGDVLTCPRDLTPAVKRPLGAGGRLDGRDDLASSQSRNLLSAARRPAGQLIGALARWGPDRVLVSLAAFPRPTRKQKTKPPASEVRYAGSPIGASGWHLWKTPAGGRAKCHSRSQRADAFQATMAERGFYSGPQSSRCCRSRAADHQINKRAPVEQNGRLSLGFSIKLAVCVRAIPTARPPTNKRS